MVRLLQGEMFAYGRLSKTTLDSVLHVSMLWNPHSCQCISNSSSDRISIFWGTSKYGFFCTVSEFPWPLLCVFCLQTSYIDKDFQKQLVNGQNHVTISRLAETVSAVTQAAPVSELTFESCFLKFEWNAALASHVLCHRSTGRGEGWTYVKRFTTEVLFLTQSQLPFRLLKLVFREFTDRLTVIFWGVSKRDLLSLIIFFYKFVEKQCLEKNFSHLH